ncbi:histidine kinase [Ginsengibacter hankyongi]|nr:histidine kinase [Ginsengibacter hankyongi]
MTILFFKITCNCNVSLMSPFRILGFANNNAFLATAIGLVAVGIRFSIEWYKQQKQNLALATLKSKSDLQVLKSRIQPDFLFHSLMSLYQKIQSGYSGSSKLVLKFSEILSYTLYDCEPEFIPLEKELVIIQEYVGLESMTNNGDCVFNLNHSGDAAGKWIVPSLLLSILQDYFNLFYINKVEAIKTDIKINIGEDHLAFLLSVQPLKENLPLVDLDNVFAGIRERLDLLLKSNYRFKLQHENVRDTIEIDIGLSHPVSSFS